MLQWTAAGARTRLCLYVHHIDAAREWADDRQANIDRLDKGLVLMKRTRKAGRS